MPVASKAMYTLMKTYVWDIQDSLPKAALYRMAASGDNSSDLELSSSIGRRSGGFVLAVLMLGLKHTI